MYSDKQVLILLTIAVLSASSVLSFVGFAIYGLFALGGWTYVLFAILIYAIIALVVKVLIKTKY